MPNVGVEPTIHVYELEILTVGRTHIVIGGSCLEGPPQVNQNSILVELVTRAFFECLHRLRIYFKYSIQLEI